MSKTIYYACKYAPLELFAGYGATFSALDPLAESFSCAERCAHANLCGYAKAVLEQVEQSGIRALVLTNCCDAMLRVYDVLAASGKMEFLQLLPVPHQSTPATRARFARGSLRSIAPNTQRNPAPYDNTDNRQNDTSDDISAGNSPMTFIDEPKGFERKRRKRRQTTTKPCFPKRRRGRR